MNEYNPNYQTYSGLEKEERRTKAPLNLEHKRFILSAMPEWRDKISLLHDALDVLRRKHPEVISLSVFGSVVKGYANESSDIDLYVHIDGDQWKTANQSKLQYFQVDNFHSKYEEMIRAELSDLLGLTAEKLKDIKVNVLTTDYVKIDCQRGEAFRQWRLFLFSLGPQIRPYRKIVLDELTEVEKATPELGNMQWERMMNNVFQLENEGLAPDLQKKRKALYPWTLEKARRIYLKKSETDE